MSAHLKDSLIVIAVVFCSAAGLQFLANVTDIFATDWATWKIVVNSGLTAVVSYGVMWLAPQVPQFGRGSDK